MDGGVDVDPADQLGEGRPFEALLADLLAVPAGRQRLREAGAVA
eukprot:SAG31_NODE_206_length_20335_cov_17.910160_2_plen_44_part_00